MNLLILMFEDDVQRAKKFMRNLKQKMPNHSITFIHETDDSNLPNILNLHGHAINLVLVDRDLNTSTETLLGKDVIERIISILDDDPLQDGLPIIYYSSIHPVSSLEKESRDYGISRCCNFNDLEFIVIQMFQ